MASPVPRLQTGSLPVLDEDPVGTSSPARGRETRNLLLNRLRAPPLVHAWDFWHEKPAAPAAPALVSPMSLAQVPRTDYTTQLTHLHSVSDVRTFWSIFNNISFESLPLRHSIHLFHAHVKPLWEDPRNARGGCWTFRVPKAHLGDVFQAICLLAIGEQLQEAVFEKERMKFKDDICGISIRKRLNGGLIQVWNRDAEHTDGIKKIKECIEASLSAGISFADGAVFYKAHSAHEAFNLSSASASVSAMTTRSATSAVTNTPAVHEARANLTDIANKHAVAAASVEAMEREVEKVKRILEEVQLGDHEMESKLAAAVEDTQHESPYAHVGWHGLCPVHADTWTKLLEGGRAEPLPHGPHRVLPPPIMEKRLTSDDERLAELGHAQSFERHFSRWSMLGLAFAILNSWTALAASLSLALPSGGPVAVLWGLVTAGICNLSLAVSLAEFLSAWPTAGGQYHWVAMVAPPRWRRGLAWVTGWVNLAGWIALVATNGLLGSQLIVGIISLEVHDYTPQRWHQFLIYIGFTLIAFCLNAFANHLLPYVNKMAFIWSILGFFVISVTVLACAAPDYATPKYVFETFFNNTNWPDGVAWLLGLLQGGLGLTGFDAVAHMACSPTSDSSNFKGPRIMVYCVCIGIFTGFLFLVTLLFVSGGATNADEVIRSTAGPLLQIFYQATSSKIGAICLLMFPLVCLLFAAGAVMTTSSRMTFAFARDGALPASRFLWRVNSSLGVPLNALCLNAVVVFVFGCIFLGSSVAFNAITAASVVALGVSYGIPIAIFVFQGRKGLPDRSFTLPSWLGWTANIIGLVYTGKCHRSELRVARPKISQANTRPLQVITTVLFLFPPAIPVSGSSMNYCVVAFAIILLISVVQWLLDGRKNFKGPQPSFVSS
ncbi:hypothetical protein FH972_022563 [Carpinus fangiana]|uniref:mRNA cap-binding protein n=1 Tax=Carpinus fangiana TaxID=176857 RepID=A0A5N6KSL4_9ROSI|nr:hypothetical protein FH972_022563 [Carpinus fangiana]